MLAATSTGATTVGTTGATSTGASTTSGATTIATTATATTGVTSATTAATTAPTVQATTGAPHYATTAATIAPTTVALSTSLSTSVAPSVSRCAPVTISGPLPIGASTISGTAALPDGAPIVVAVNGEMVGTAVVSGSRWLLHSVVWSLASGDVVLAAACDGASVARLIVDDGCSRVNEEGCAVSVYVASIATCDGHIHGASTGPAGATVAVYVDDRLAAETTVHEDGLWTVCVGRTNMYAGAKVSAAVVVYGDVVAVSPMIMANVTCDAVSPPPTVPTITVDTVSACDVAVHGSTSGVEVDLGTGATHGAVRVFVNSVDVGTTSVSRDGRWALHNVVLMLDDVVSAALSVDGAVSAVSPATPVSCTCDCHALPRVLFAPDPITTAHPLRRTSPTPHTTIQGIARTVGKGAVTVFANGSPVGVGEVSSTRRWTVTVASRLLPLHSTLTARLTTGPRQSHAFSAVLSVGDEHGVGHGGRSLLQRGEAVVLQPTLTPTSGGLEYCVQLRHDNATRRRLGCLADATWGQMRCECFLNGAVLLAVASTPPFDIAPTTPTVTVAPIAQLPPSSRCAADVMALAAFFVAVTLNVLLSLWTNTHATSNPHAISHVATILVQTSLAVLTLVCVSRSSPTLPLLAPAACGGAVALLVYLPAALLSSLSRHLADPPELDALPTWERPSQAFMLASSLCVYGGCWLMSCCATVILYVLTRDLPTDLVVSVLWATAHYACIAHLIVPATTRVVAWGGNVNDQRNESKQD